MVTEIVGTARVSDFKHGAFLRGAASAFDLRGNTARHYRMSGSPSEADMRALLGDLRAVRSDMRTAARRTGDE
jgi:hypothetical protein